MKGLAYLSIERVPPGRAPRQPPTNTDRVRAFRAHQPVVFANACRLPVSRFERYAAEQCADAAPSTDDMTLGYAELSGGF